MNHEALISELYTLIKDHMNKICFRSYFSVLKQFQGGLNFQCGMVRWRSSYWISYCEVIHAVYLQFISLKLLYICSLWGMSVLEYMYCHTTVIQLQNATCLRKYLLAKVKEIYGLLFNTTGYIIEYHVIPMFKNMPGRLAEVWELLIFHFKK